MAALSCLSIAAVEPECVNGLIDENLIPMVRLGSPQAFQETFQVIRVIFRSSIKPSTLAHQRIVRENP